jgi:superfamily I DNA/RNA helicase
MKIPSHLCLSRHGVYYFRQTSQKAGKQRAKKISLHTKDPSIAKQKAIELLALLNKFSGEAIGITLSTIHSAKGMEWKHVILVDMTDGVLPHFREIRRNNTDEERRLF